MEQFCMVVGLCHLEFSTAKKDATRIYEKTSGEKKSQKKPTPKLASFHGEKKKVAQTSHHIFALQSIVRYHIYTKYSDTQTDVISIESDQTPPSVASNQGLHRFALVGVGTWTGGKMNLYKELWCMNI